MLSLVTLRIEYCEATLSNIRLDHLNPSCMACALVGVKDFRKIYVGVGQKNLILEGVSVMGRVFAERGEEGG